LFAPGILPDGTVPRLPESTQDRILTNLESELNKADPESARPLKIPTDYRALLGMVGGNIGPGLPLYRAASGVSAVHGLMSRVYSKDSISEATSKWPKDGWEIATGWRSGTSEHRAATFVMFCRCTSDHKKEYKDWAWRYAIVSGMSGGEVFMDLVDFLDGYMDIYEESLRTAFDLPEISESLSLVIETSSTVEPNNNWVR
jgi:hypothetical protein